MSTEIHGNDNAWCRHSALGQMAPAVYGAGHHQAVMAAACPGSPPSWDKVTSNLRDLPDTKHYILSHGQWVDAGTVDAIRHQLDGASDSPSEETPPA